MKIIKEKTIKYKLVIPETKEEKEELDKLIEESKKEIDADINEFEWHLLGESSGSPIKS